MSTITLSCLVVGENPYENAFEVDIEKDKSISKLKEAIKEKKQNDFAGVDADKLKLWKVEISGDHVDPLTLHDNDELLAINDIGDYWTEKPLKKHIHVLVEPPVTTATSDEVLELREEVASLKEKLSKSTHGTYKFWAIF